MFFSYWICLSQISLLSFTLAQTTREGSLKMINQNISILIRKKKVLMSYNPTHYGASEINTHFFFFYSVPYLLPSMLFPEPATYSKTQAYCIDSISVQTALSQIVKWIIFSLFSSICSNVTFSIKSTLAILLIIAIFPPLTLSNFLLLPYFFT